MQQIKVAIRLRSLQQPFKKALHTAATLQADGVEIDARREFSGGDLSHTGVRHLRILLNDANLRVAAVEFRTRRGLDVAEDLEQRLDAMRRAMRLAYDLGAGVVINQIGTALPANEAAWNCMLEALTDLGNYGHRVGCLLAADAETTTNEQLSAVLAALPEASLSLHFDPAGLVMRGESAADFVHNFGPHIAHVHARDGVRDFAQRRGLEVPLGRGTVDFAELLGALEEHRYAGYFTVRRDEPAHPVAEVGQAVSYLRNLVE